MALDQDSQARSVRIYACLNALKGENADVLAPLAFFFEEYFFISDGKAFSQSHLVKFAETALVWKITEDVVEDFIPHFEKMGWLARHGTVNQAVYAITHPRPSESSHLDPTIELIETLRQTLYNFISTAAPSRLGDLGHDELDTRKNRVDRPGDAVIGA